MHLKFKTDVLWVMQDALYHSYINGHVPPGALYQRILMTDILKIDEKLYQNFLNMLNSGIIKLETNGLFLLLKDLLNLMILLSKYFNLLMEKSDSENIASELSQKFNAPEEVIISMM